MGQRIRSKREAERLAHYEESERQRQAALAAMRAPGDGYASIGLLPVMALEVCLRCSATVYGRERHDEWHRAHERVLA